MSDRWGGGAAAFTLASLAALFDQKAAGLMPMASHHIPAHSLALCAKLVLC